MKNTRNNRLRHAILTFVLCRQIKTDRPMEVRLKDTD